MERLSGVSLPVAMGTGDVTFTESALFTHRGLSGPAALQLSSYWIPGEDIWLNLLPEHDAAALLLKAKTTQPKLVLRTVLSRILPRALVLELETLLWPEFAQRPLAEISNDVLKGIATVVSQRFVAHPV